MTLYIVRHGNTFEPGEPPRRIGARTDLPLTAAGREQALALGTAFRKAGIAFDRLLVSPLRRTRETAALILTDAVDAPPAELAEWLAEIDHGPDEGRTEAEVLARTGAAAIAAWDKAGTPLPGWQVDAPRRIDGWRSVFAGQRRAPAETILLVTSNGAARFVFAADPGLEKQARTLPSRKLRTGAWGRIAFSEGAPVLELWDRRG